MDLVTLACAGALCALDFPGKQLVSRDADFPVAAQVECIARNVRMEARGEDDLGKVAVIAVVVNRMRDPRWRAAMTETRRIGRHYVDDESIFQGRAARFGAQSARNGNETVKTGVKKTR